MEQSSQWFRDHRQAGLRERVRPNSILLCVSQDHQRHGVGSVLVEAALATARKAGARRMILWTQPSMEAARLLYSKHGFERVPELDFSRGERIFRVFARSI